MANERRSRFVCDDEVVACVVRRARYALGVKRSSIVLLVALVFSVPTRGRAVVARPARAQCSINAVVRGGEWALSLQIDNGRAPLALPYFAPVVLGQLVVRREGARLSLAEPAVDMAVQSRTLRLAPNARVEVPVVQRLRFRPASGPLLSSDRFVITIDHPRAEVSLGATFGQGPNALDCRGVLRPAP